MTDKPVRTPESITTANTSLNLDKDQLKYALFWFISGSSMDDIALKHLQAGNREKAEEIFLKKETYSSLINSGVLAFIDGNTATGFNNISKVVHNSAYRTELLQALGIANLQLSEDDLAELVISELLKEVPASKLLSACTNATDRAIVSKKALVEPISVINSAIAVAQNADSKNPEASLAAGTKLMNSTKASLKAVKDIAGATSPQYQMVADNVAKQVLLCGINYYNNAPDSDVESPRKAMVLYSYALSIAVGQLTKDRCKEQYDILKQAVDNMPPAEVAIETRKVKEELRKFCQLPDKISHSITLLKNTKPLLKIIKSKLGASNAFYLSLSTQVVGNALHNLIEEINQEQEYLSNKINSPFRHFLSESDLHDIKASLTKAWDAILLMDSFDMELEFKFLRYETNRKSLKDLCKSFKVNADDPLSYTIQEFFSGKSNKKTYITIIVILAILIGSGLIWGPITYKVSLIIIGVLSCLFMFAALSDSEWRSALLSFLIAIIGIGGFCLWQYIDYDNEYQLKAEEAYYMALEEDNIGSLKEFINDYPKSKFTDNALEELYHKCISSGWKDITEFAAKYNNTKWGEEAFTVVREKCDSILESSGNSSIIGSHRYNESFRLLNEGSSYPIISFMEEIVWENEDAAWSLVLETDSIAYYERFTREFPNSDHVSLAEKRIIDLEVNDVFNGSYSELPKLNHSRNGSGSTSTISIYNNTSYTLTVLYSGLDDSKRITILAHQRESVTLPNGKYRCVASISSIANDHAGTENLTGGSYEVEYYIISSKFPY